MRCYNYADSYCSSTNLHLRTTFRIFISSDLLLAVTPARRHRIPTPQQKNHRLWTPTDQESFILGNFPPGRRKKPVTTNGNPFLIIINFILSTQHWFHFTARKSFSPSCPLIARNRDGLLLDISTCHPCPVPRSTVFVFRQIFSGDLLKRKKKINFKPQGINHPRVSCDQHAGTSVDIIMDI